MRIEKRDYSLELSDQTDICENLEDELSGYTYICDGISEQADSCVDIYNHDLWESAKDFQEWIERAQKEGLSEGVTDLIKLFQIGQYQYYTQMAYDNEKEIYFNIILALIEGSEDEKAKLITEEEIEEAAEEIDNNDNGSIFEEKVQELINNVEDK